MSPIKFGLTAAILATAAVLALMPSTALAATATPQTTAAAAPTQSMRSRQDSMLQVTGMCGQIEGNLLGRIDYYWHEGDYPRVIKVSRVVTEIDPAAVETYSTGGWLMESDGDDKDAEAYYRLGVNRNPASTYMAYQLGFFYFQTMHRYDKSVVVMKRSTQLPDAGALDWKLLAHSYQRDGQYEKAVAAWKHIKQNWPKAPAVDKNLQEAEAALASHGSGQTTTN